MKKRLISFFIGLFVTGMLLSNAHADVRIGSIFPASGPPGSILMIGGEDLLPMGEKRVIFFFNVPGHLAGTTIPIFMELAAMNWNALLIEARVPGLDEGVFRMNMNDVPMRLSDTVKEYINSREITGLVGIYEKRSGVWYNYSSGFYFTLSRSPENPVIHMLSRTSVHIGDGLMIYGSGFGTGPRDVVFVKGGTETSRAVSSRSSTFVSLTIPSMEGGSYDVIINRDGVLSNSRSINISTIEGIPESPGLTLPEEGAGPGIDRGIEEGVGIPVEGRPEPSIDGPRVPSDGSDLGIPTMIHPACEAIYPIIPPPAETPYSCTFWFWTNRGEITSIEPASGPPGTFVEVKGKCFGEEQGTRKILISGAEFLEPRELEVISWSDNEPRELEVISWSDNKIIARIPGPELIYTSPAGGEEVARFSDGAIQYIYELGDHPIRSKISITMGEYGRDNKTFTISPPGEDDAPVLCCTKPTALKAGETIKIYGTGFGDEPLWGISHMFFKKVGTDRWFSGSSVKMWSSTMINIQMPNDVVAGNYEMYVQRPRSERDELETLDSNIIKFDLLPTLLRDLEELTPIDTSRDTLDVKAAPSTTTMERQPVRSGTDMELEYKAPEVKPMTPPPSKKKKSGTILFPTSPGPDKNSK